MNRPRKRRKLRPFPWEPLFRRSLPLEHETVVFILVSALDVFLTYLLLSHSEAGLTTVRFVESNAVARFFLHGWGPRGMVYFKFVMVAVVTVIAQVIARRRIETARRLLNVATLIVGGVVIYSVMLFARHTTLL
jgi:hypothetical protein